MSITIAFVPPTLRPLTYPIASGMILMRGFWLYKLDLIQFISQETGLHSRMITFRSRQSDTRSYVLAINDVVELKGIEIGVILATKLPHASSETHEALQLLLSDHNQADLISLREMKHLPNENFRHPITVTNVSKQVCEIEYRGEKLIPFALMSNDEGIEMRGEYSYEFKLASQTHIKEVSVAREKREFDIVHSKKLLRDLPVALENSRKETKQEAANQIQIFIDSVSE